MGSFTLSPASGNVLIPPNRQVTVSWSSAPDAGAYDVQIYPTGTSSGSECSVANSYCAVLTTSTQFTFTAPEGVTNYSWRVRGVNTTCSPELLGQWVTGTFTLVGDLSGNIYYDDLSQASLNLATGKCELSGSLIGQNPGVGATIEALWSGGSRSGSVSDSTFSVPSVLNVANVSLTLVPDLSQYRCTCPAGCTMSGVSVPSVNNPFFITQSAQEWWQVQGGLVYAGTRTGNAVISFVPDTAGSQGFLNLRNVQSASSSSGFIVTGGGDIDSTLEISTRYSRLRQDTEQSRIIGSTFSGARENYQYFYNLYSMGSSPVQDFTGVKPSAAPTNGRAYYGSGDVTINSNWTVENGESLVIFVNGNLIVQANISVAEGGFLAFIVNGDIRFANTVGSPSPASNTATVAGVFIANQIIVEGGLAGGDLKFIGEGTFVGWSGVQLQRSYANSSDNNISPIEVFRHRPDFVKNVPQRMTRPIYSWQEVN